MRSRTLGAICLVSSLGVLASAGVARATEPDPTTGTREPSAAQIRPPRAIATSVGYPEGASGDATVVLELTIDATGHVSSIGTTEGPEMFADAAREAAKDWLFRPAERDGKAVSAKIRFEVRFSGEHPVEPSEPVGSAPDSSSRPASASPAAPPPPPKEYVVTVNGERTAPGAESVPTAEARMLAGTFGDPMRSVELLSGVTPIVSVLPYFYLRGAPPGNVGYFIDGIRVPFLFHALLGPSVLSPALIDTTNLYKSAPPPEFGRFAGGVVSSEVLPPPEALHAQGGVHTLDAGGFVSTPLADGKSQVFAAGRYSYAGLIISRVTNATLNYWDYQVLANYELSRNDTVGIFGFGALDYVGYQNGQTYAGTQFHRIDLRYDHRFDANTKIRTAITLGYDRSIASQIGPGAGAGPIQGPAPPPPGGDVGDRSIAARAIFEHRLSPSAVLRAGADVSFDDYSLNVSDPTLSFRDATTLFPARLDVVTGAYTEIEFHPFPRVTFRPGVRADLYHSLNATLGGFDPRVSAEFQVSSKVKLIDDFGVSHQTPNYFPELPGAQVGGLPGGLQTTAAYSSGVEVLLPEDFKATLTGFEQAFLNLSDPLGFSGSIAANVDVATIRGTGYAYGAELDVRRPLSKTVGGIFSYTLSRSVRDHDNLDSLSAFDRTHTVSFAVGYLPGKRWTLGVRGLFFTGVPTRTVTVDGPVYGGDRAAPYFRLDLHVEKRWRLGEHGYISAVADVINATAGTEVVQRSCNVQRCTNAAVGPLVLPNVGVEAGF